MKLSEAIRLGAMTGPQNFDSYFGENGASCALGAAAIASGEYVVALERRYDAYNAPCPVCGTYAVGRLVGNVGHLNDFHRWTREQIADWVESIEQQHEAASAPQPAEEVGVQ